MHSKFNIADKVLSNKFGAPSVYLVVGAIDGEAYYEGLKETRNEGTGDRWTMVYPSWQENLVYFLRTSHPQKSLSFSEYLEQMPDGTRELYELLPNQTVYALPESDLTSLDDL